LGEGFDDNQVDPSSQEDGERLSSIEFARRLRQQHPIEPYEAKISEILQRNHSQPPGFNVQ
jgi:hypothetical protein